ncbi:hypothetical protein D3C73_1555070 [compost metagenome]
MSQTASARLRGLERLSRLATRVRIWLAETAAVRCRINWSSSNCSSALKGAADGAR